MKRHEVAVAGGGVVGAATALALARQGFEVALIEKGAAPAAFQPEPHDLRVYAIAPGSVRFLDQLGAWAGVAARRVSTCQSMRVWDRDPAQALRFDAAELGVPELGHIVEDKLLRASLWQGLEGRVSVYAGCALASWQGGARSRLTLEDGRVLDAELVVAAEGAESRLRQWAGIEPGGWTYSQRSIVCNVTTGKPHRAAALQHFLPRGPLAFLPLADGRSSIVWSTDETEAAELMALDDSEFRARLLEASDGELGGMLAVTPRLAFPLRLMHATEYARPGLVLVGDSAHVIHPLAGQGMNLGLADAEALTEVLTEARAAKRVIGGLRVLQRYERRRKAANLEMMALTDGLHRLFRSRVPAVRLVRELGMSLVGRAGPVKSALAKRAMGI